MESEQIHFDEQGIPVLENVVDPQSLPPAQKHSGKETGDHERIEALLQGPEARQLIEALGEDIQKMLSVKIEAILREELDRLLREAAQQRLGGLADDIRTRLQTALPELLAKIAAQGKT